MAQTHTYPDVNVARSGADALGEKAHGGIDRLTSGAHDSARRVRSCSRQRTNG